jgi:hypothetical protein
VIVYKWRIVLGGLAAASFLGTFAAGPALASTASPDRVPVVVTKAALPNAGQLVTNALGAVTALSAWAAGPSRAVVSAVTQPVSGVLPAGPSGGTPARTASTPGLPALTGVVPAVGAATGALLSGVGSIVSGVASTLLPAVGPAVGGLTVPVDGLTQDLGNLAGLPVIGSLISGIPALPDTGALLGDLNGLVNGTAKAAS